MTSATYPAGTYRGQASQIQHRCRVEYRNRLQRPPRGRRITKYILSQPNLAPTVGATARSTLAANATKNTVVPYHLGARRALASGARRDDSRLSQEFLSEVDP
jgi:hypothetical protein